MSLQPSIGVALVNPGKAMEGVAAVAGIPAFKFSDSAQLKSKADIWLMSMSPEQMSAAHLFDEPRLKDENFLGVSIRALAFELGLGGRTDDYAVRATAATFLASVVESTKLMLDSVLGARAPALWAEAVTMHGSLGIHELVRGVLRPSHWDADDVDVVGIVRGVAVGPKLQEGKQNRGNATFLLPVNRVMLYEFLTGLEVPAGQFDRIDGGDATYAPNRAAVLSLALARAANGRDPGFAHVFHRGLKSKNAHAYARLWGKNAEYPLSFMEANALHSSIKFEAVRVWKSRENVSVRAASAIRLPVFAEHAKGMIHPGLVANILTKAMTTFERAPDGNLIGCDSMCAWLAGCARGFVMEQVLANYSLMPAKVNPDSVKASISKDRLASYRAMFRESGVFSYPAGLIPEETKEAPQELEYQKDWGAG